MYVCVGVSVCVCALVGVPVSFTSLFLHTFIPTLPHTPPPSHLSSLTPPLTLLSLSSYPPIPILTSHTHHTSSPLLSHTLTLTSFFPHTPHLHPPHPHPPHPLPPSQVRASSELERQQVVSEVRRQAEAEKEIAIAETKKKKWVKRPLMCCV